MTTPRILIVEDQSSMRMALRDFLLAAFPEATIDTVEDGAGALAYCWERIPDLVLMDVELPDGNGIQLTARLIIRHPGLRVIVISYVESIMHAGHALSAGARAFIPKASLDRELVAVVARNLPTGPRAACR